MVSSAGQPASGEQISSWKRSVYNPRPKGRFKKRLSLDQARALERQGIVIPTDQFKSPLEKTGRQEGRKYMMDHGWLVIPFQCDEVVKGFPDTTCYHAIHGHKLVEWKSHRPGHCLEDSQVEMFDKLERHGALIYVLRDANDYGKLFEPPNWHKWIKIRSGG